MMRRHSDILAVLQSVAGIVKLRHAANVLSRRTASIGFMDLDIGPLVLEAPARHIGEVFALSSPPVAKLEQAVALSLPRTSYFSRKVNGRKWPLMRSP
ncbi:hypothetical protein ACTJKQ_15425 [Acidovorax sp. 22279]|jgi:hypothetical protein